MLYYRNNAGLNMCKEEASDWLKPDSHSKTMTFANFKLQFFTFLHMDSLCGDTEHPQQTLSTMDRST